MSDYLDFDYINDEEDNNDVEIPVPENMEIKYKKKELVISSADRNKDKFPSCSNYEILLKEPFEDISEITLIEGNIPACQYNINNYNNVLYLSEQLGDIIDPNTHVREIIPPIAIKIPIGNYLNINYEEYGDSINYKDKLSCELEKQLNIYGTNKYKIAYNPRLNKYLFSCIKNGNENEDLNNQKTYFQLQFQGNLIKYGEYSYEKIIKRNQYGEIIYDKNGDKIYEEVFIGEKMYDKKKNAINKIIGFHNKNYDGLLEGHVESDSMNNKKIIGTNTHFLNDLEVGFYITIASKDYNEMNISYSFEVESIENDTELLIKEEIQMPFSNFQIYTNSFYSPFLRNLFPYNPVALLIPQWRRLFSSNTIINNSFCIFEGPKENDYSSILYYDDSRIITKSFNPPLGKLDKIRIKFFNTEYYGTYYDFGNRDHKLTFLITYYAQNRKYYHKINKH